MPRFSVPVRCTFVVHHDVEADDAEHAKKIVDERIRAENRRNCTFEREINTTTAVMELPDKPNRAL